MALHIGRASSQTEDRMRRHTLVAAVLLTGCAAGQSAFADPPARATSCSHPNSSLGEMDESGRNSRKGIATLHHDPHFIMQAVAQRMGVSLRSEISAPVILLESRTPLECVQAAAERQWGLRPPVFISTYASAENAIYLIDDADHYNMRNARTLDDALAHEFVHYFQANYRGDRFSSEWSEVEALTVQAWFRKEYMAPLLAAAAPAAEPKTRGDRAEEPGDPGDQEGALRAEPVGDEAYEKERNQVAEVEGALDRRPRRARSGGTWRLPGA